jgi:glycosyltransferase involved in cell wall biosynthesis
VGPELAKWFQHKYKRKVEVVKNVPSLDKQLPYRPDDDKFILYQGALNAGRGLENLIQAMENIPCKLILAGDGDLTHELKQLANRGTAAGRIEFLGRVAPEELPLLTSRAYIGVNISENAGLSYWLSLNNKFFDYAMAGLPQLVNPFPEYEAFNAIYEVGILTKSDAHIIAEQANLLLNAPDLHQQLHENCLRAAEKWNWEQEKKHLLRIFEDEFELG